MMHNIPKHTPGKVYEPHEIESAADHLMAAQKVKDNPELHAHALKHLDKMKGHITSIQQLKKKAQELEHNDNAMEEAVETPKEEQAESPFPDAVHGNKKMAAAVKSDAAKSTHIKKK